MDFSSLSDPSLDQKTRIDRYKQALTQLLAGPDIAGLKAFVEHVASEGVALVVSRQVLGDFATALAPDKFGTDQLKDLGTFVLEKIGSRMSSFEEQASTIRERLAAVYEQQEDWSLAAKMLAAIPLDSGIRVLEDNYKIEKLIKISMLFLEDEASHPSSTPRAPFEHPSSTLEWPPSPRPRQHALSTDAQSPPAAPAGRSRSARRRTSTARRC